MQVHPLITQFYDVGGGGGEKRGRAQQRGGVRAQSTPLAVLDLEYVVDATPKSVVCLAIGQV